MKIGVRLLAAADTVRHSYWFLPGSFALAGLAAAIGLVAADGLIGNSWLGQITWFTQGRPEGARAVLSTIASSTITVAGVVFSITLAAVTYASGQYGPRLLTNFQRDQGNQATLGVFIATFLYCLVVLRTIRSAEEASADTGGAVREAFVPHAATCGALALAFASIGMLVYFVHHVTDSIHINNVIARIGQSLVQDARRLPPAQDDGAPPDLSGMHPVPAEGAGYVKAIDQDALLELAVEHGSLLVVACRAGDFLWAGRPLVHIHPGPVTEDLATEVRRAFATGRTRTALQDLLFGIDELAEIAARALSPGVNDPFTAFACIDWLGATLVALPGRGQTRAVRCGPDGEPRVLATATDYAAFVQASFGRLRPYLARDPNAHAHALTVLDKVIESVEPAADRALLVAERVRLVTARARHDRVRRCVPARPSGTRS